MASLGIIQCTYAHALLHAKVSGIKLMSGSFFDKGFAY